MNPRLSLLQPYPFERLRQWCADVTPNPARAPVDLSIGEPRHPTPSLVTDALAAGMNGLANYPMTIGPPALRAAIAAWLVRRHGLAALDPETEVLPVLGSREALFAFAQTVVDSGRAGALVLMPNPFYQIYEGAAFLAGAAPYCVNALATNGFAPSWRDVPEAVWSRTNLVYVCSPDNPTGRVTTRDEWAFLFEMSDRHGFVIAADECYSEVYFDEARPPVGALAVAQALGRTGFPRLVSFGSLSKRSNAPGLRSGYAAGDKTLMRAFLLYRTYHGSAMSGAVAAASIAAWSDEAHVVANRTEYAAKFAALQPRLAGVLPCAMPDAAFYLWARTPIDDALFAKRLLAEENVKVLPGSFLARDAHGVNPGRGYIRIALVAARRRVRRRRRAHRHLRPVALTRVRPVGSGATPSRSCPAGATGTRIRPMPSATSRFPSGVLPALARGFRFSWTSILIILLVNTGIATLESVEDIRPFWHPFVTVQACGIAIAYCVNVAAPWANPRPILRMAIAVAIGATLGHALMIPIKNFILEQLLDQPRLYTLAYLASHAKTFFFSFLGAFLVGLCISAFFLLKFRDARAAEALHKAEAERLLLAKHAMESELKLMQAQIEPHFLFNTLASVQFLTETDPAAGLAAAGPSPVLPARRAAADAQRQHDARPGDRVRRGLSQHPENADGTAARFRHRRARLAAQRIRSRRCC